MTSQIPPCIVNPADYGDDYAQNNECPSFHVFLFVAMPRVLEAIGHEWLIALATVATAFFTATLWWSTRKLWEAARNTALVQERDTKILQRAYLAVEPTGINPFISETQDQVVGHVNIINVGRLPARVWISDKEPRIFVTSRILTEAELPTESGRQIGVLVPGGKMPIGTYTISDDSLGTRDQFVYVWRLVEYFDGFSPEKRFTKFCHRYPCRPYSSMDGRKGIDAKHARYHEHGNDAD